MKSSCRHCGDAVHSGSWIRIWIMQCGKCFEFWLVLPNGIKTLRLTVKIGTRPIQKTKLVFIDIYNVLYSQKKT